MVGIWRRRGLVGRFRGHAARILCVHRFRGAGQHRGRSEGAGEDAAVGDFPDIGDRNHSLHSCGMGGLEATTDERERMKALERENRELRQANEILRKASAYFAQAELDRRWKP